MTFSDLVNMIMGTIGLVIPLIIGMALITFIYGIILYISRAGDESKREEGVRYIFYGIIGLFVMVSVWGIIEILNMTLFGDGVVGVPVIRIGQ